MNLLHIDSSILGDNSVTRALTADIVKAYREATPDLVVAMRDLAAEPLPHLSAADLATLKDNDYLKEVLTADVIVIGVPMYNFGMPSQLKAWLDRLLIAGTTFRYTATGVEGLVPGGKTVVLAVAHGGFYTEGPAAAHEHAETHLKAALGFVGLSHIQTIYAEGIGMGPEARATAMDKARSEIAKLVG